MVTDAKILHDEWFSRHGSVTTQRHTTFSTSMLSGQPLPSYFVTKENVMPCRVGTSLGLSYCDYCVRLYPPHLPTPDLLIGFAHTLLGDRCEEDFLTWALTWRDSTADGPAKERNIPGKAEGCTTRDTMRDHAFSFRKADISAFKGMQKTKQIRGGYCKQLWWIQGRTQALMTCFMMHNKTGRTELLCTKVPFGTSSVAESTHESCVLGVHVVSSIYVSAHTSLEGW